MSETVEAYNIRLQVDFKQSRPKNANKYFPANNRTAIKNVTETKMLLPASKVSYQQC